VTNVPVVKPRGVIAAFSRTDRTGDWELPEHLRVVAVFGDIRLDLRRARFLPGISEIEVLAVVAQIRITVPHGVRVECHAGGLITDIRVKRVSNATPRPDAPCVRVTGSTYMGSVLVRVVDPEAR
jgi:cell wall-active antibiotic response 4TMS protein YvqF